MRKTAEAVFQVNRATDCLRKTAREAPTEATVQLPKSTLARAREIL